ncbi:MAG: META domain-containing protein [bacterium]
MKKLLILSAIILSISLISAKNDPEYVKNWKLVTMNGADVKQECTMKITPNGTFVGKGFCNNFTGNLAFDGKRKVTCNQNIAATKKMCAENMEAENEFMNTLKKVTTYEIEDDQLILKFEKQAVLVFNKVIEPKKTKKQKKIEEKEAEEKAKRDAEKAKKDIEQAKIDAEKAREDAKKAAKDAKKNKK